MRLFDFDVGYPDIGIPFGQTHSTGYDLYYMDYREVSEDGEPIIIRYDNQFGRTNHVAENLAEFLKMVCRNEDGLGVHGGD